MESDEDARKLTLLEGGVLWTFLAAALASAVSALWEASPDRAASSAGVSLVFYWLLLNPWILKEKPFQTDLFADGDFERIEYLYGGVGLALLSMFCG